MKEWTTPDPLNTPSTANLEEEEIVGALGNDGNASMPEQVKRPNPWRRKMMMMMIKAIFPAFYNTTFMDLTRLSDSSLTLLVLYE